MITGHRIANLAAEIISGNYTVVSGVTPEEGGQDEGPNPHRLVEAALAACTIITVQMYANRKAWPLTNTNVKVSITSETKTDSHFVREISFEGDLSDEQRSRLMEIADKCPIHNLLQGKVTIETKPLG